VREFSQTTCSGVSAVTRTSTRMPGKWWWMSAKKPTSASWPCSRPASMVRATSGAQRVRNAAKSEALNAS
jgi:hypothetical protein